jgi:hypothetical protein
VLAVRRSSLSLVEDIWRDRESANLGIHTCMTSGNFWFSFSPAINGDIRAETDRVRPANYNYESSLR